MASLLRMPAVAANAVSAVLQGWPVPEGSAFSAMDAIATVETEKAVVDVEAEADGVILKALVSAGAEVEVGAPIAILGEPGEKIDDLDSLLATLGVVASTQATTPERREIDVPSVPPAPPPETTDVADHGATRQPHGSRIFVSPLARRQAREADLSLADVIGSGPGGRIIRRDIAKAIASRDARPATAAPVTQPPQPYTDVPHTRIRKVIASRLTQSQSTPHFYLRGTCRVDTLLQARQQLNEISPVKISINDMVIKAAARAHMLVPTMNAIWTDDAVRSYSSVDISVAIATERGLVTPVLHAVERLPISEVAGQMQDYARRAKSGSLRQDELEGGALTITNLGMFGTEEFAAIINPPQSAILAIGATQQDAVVVAGELKVATVMRVTLSVDHRPIDGAVAAEWMRVFTSLVEHPIQVFA